MNSSSSYTQFEVEENAAITEWVQMATHAHGAKIEEWMRLYIRPRPWWLPRGPWEALLQRAILLVVKRGS